MKRRILLADALATAGAIAAPHAFSAERMEEYEIPVLGDYSGPFADLTKRMAAREQVMEWWNVQVGKNLGVKLKPKTYDTHYNAGTVASIWSGVVAGKKPILGLGLGGPSVSALQQRLPSDKIPVLYATPGYGFAWAADQWIFNIRALYVAEFLTGLKWFIATKKLGRPANVAFISTQDSPAFVDTVKGMTKYIKEKMEPKNEATIVATEWVSIQPVDLTSQLQRIKAAKADIIFGVEDTAMAGAVIRAEALLGAPIPTMSSPWHTIWPVSEAQKTYKPWEGHYTVTGIVPIGDTGGEAHVFYEQLAQQYKLSKVWDPLTLLGISQGIVAVRAVEQAVRKYGAKGLTGQHIYDVLEEHEFTEKELKGIMKDLKFDKSAPFPLHGWVKIMTVKDGKYQMAENEWLPTPDDIQKW